MTVLFVGTSHATAPLATIERLGFDADDADRDARAHNAGRRDDRRSRCASSSCCRRVIAWSCTRCRPTMRRDRASRSTRWRSCSRAAGTTCDAIDAHGATSRRHRRDATPLSRRRRTRVDGARRVGSARSGRVGARARACVSARPGRCSRRCSRRRVRTGRRARAETGIATRTSERQLDRRRAGRGARRGAAWSSRAVPRRREDRAARRESAPRSWLLGDDDRGARERRRRRARRGFRCDAVSAGRDRARNRRERSRVHVRRRRQCRSIAAIVRRAMRGRMARPLAFIDLAAGDALDAGVAELAGVRVVGPAELRERIDLAIAGRRREAPLVETIVEEELRALQARAEGSSLSGVVAALRARAEEIRQRELARALASLPNADAGGAHAAGVAVGLAREQAARRTDASAPRGGDAGPGEPVRRRHARAVWAPGASAPTVRLPNVGNRNRESGSEPVGRSSAPPTFGLRHGPSASPSRTRA